jgi:hypothetical protein
VAQNAEPNNDSKQTALGSIVTPFAGPLRATPVSIVILDGCSTFESEPASAGADNPLLHK